MMAIITSFLTSHRVDLSVFRRKTSPNNRGVVANVDVDVVGAWFEEEGVSVGFFGVRKEGEREERKIESN